MKAPETSLQINKNIYFTNITQKTAISMATNMRKKTYFAVWWVVQGAQSQRILCL